VSRTVHLVAPATLDDPTRPSGGNAYDRRACAELEGRGWTVGVHTVPGAWPDPVAADLAALDATLASVPRGETVLADGLVASSAPEVVARHATSLRTVVLVHQPLGLVSAERRAGEAALLGSVAAVVTTSAWSRDWLLDEYAVPADRVAVAVPGTDPAGRATGTDDGGSLLCVGAVTPGKGHDVLLDALAGVDAHWRCTVVGSLDVDASFARAVARRAADVGRVDLLGALDPQVLDAAYLAADVLVLPSRAETYGMVVAEALAHGLPVVGSAVGGVPEALGTTASGEVPGILVPADDADALADAIRQWLADPAVRARLRTAARDRSGSLPRWSETAASLEEVLRA
jgi:glycosyltransferase involved in cell wall biosynthesis